MKNKIKFVLIIILLSGALLGQEVPVKYSKFKKSIEIKLEDLEVTSIPSVLLYEMKLVALKDFLISFNSMNDTIFRVFRLPNLEYYGAFGVKGRGPREYNIFEPIREADGILIPQLLRFDLVSFKTGQKVNNSNFEILKSYKTPAAFSTINQAMVISDTLICCSGSLGSEKHLICFNPQNGKIHYFLDYPALYKTAPKGANHMLYNSDKSLSPDKTMIAVAYRNFPLLRIYNSRGALLKETFVDEGPKQIRNIDFASNQVLNNFKLLNYYGRLHSTSRYIYASYKVISYSGPGFTGKQEHTSNQIHIFDWKGTPLVKISLPKALLFTPSIDDKYLFFVTNEYSDRIFKFPLSAALNYE